MNEKGKIPNELTDKQKKEAADLLEYTDRVQRRFFIFESLCNSTEIANPLTGKISREPGILMELTQVLLQANNAVRLNSKNPIELFIDSPGGYILPTLVFCDLMQETRIPVYTIGWGRAYSGAGIILICGEKGHRYMFRDATLMLHSPRFLGLGAGVYDEDKLVELTNKLRNGTRHLVHLIKKNSKLTEAKIRKYLKKEKIFTAKEALEAGLIDKIVTTKTLVNEIGHSLIEITNELPSVPKEPGKNKKK